MKRRIIELTLFLLAGAIINVAVAWGCAKWLRFDTESRVSLTADEQAILDGAGEVYRPAIIFFQRTGFGIKQRSVPLEDPLEQTRIGEEAERQMNAGGGIINMETALAFLHHLEAGWPFGSMGTRLWDHSLNWLDANAFAETTSPFRIEYGIYFGTPLPQRHTFGLRLDEQHRILPLRPLWPGFAINTIFYAAIVWMLCAVPGAVRRRVRIKRGQCASCGYSLRENTSDVCPECGKSA